LRTALLSLLHTYIESGRSVDLLVRTASEAVVAGQKVAFDAVEKLHGRPGEPIRPGTKTIDLDLSPEQLVLVQKLMSAQESRYRALPALVYVMALIYVVALYEGLLADAYATALRHVPAKLKSSRQLTYEAALAYPTRKDLVRELARRATREFTDLSFLKQVDWLKSAYGFDLLEHANFSADAIVKILMRRNLFVHNNGVATPEYRSVTGDPVPVGTRIVVDDAEFKQSRRHVEWLGRDFVHGLIASLCSRAGPFTPADVDLLRE
jgi:hypothetical protein